MAWLLWTNAWVEMVWEVEDIDDTEEGPEEGASAESKLLFSKLASGLFNSLRKNGLKY